LCQVLEEGFKKKQGEGSRAPTSKVERYKDEHPAWHGKAPEEIGEHFAVDYVISLEINTPEPLMRLAAQTRFSTVSAKSPSMSWTCTRPERRAHLP